MYKKIKKNNRVLQIIPMIFGILFILNQFAVVTANELTSFEGKTIASSEDMVSLFQRQSPVPYPQIYVENENVDLEKFVSIVFLEAEKENLRGDLVFAQILVDINWFQFVEELSPEKYNFGSFRDEYDNYKEFSSIEEGVKRNIEQVKDYINNDLHVEDLNQFLAKQAYADKIKSIVDMAIEDEISQQELIVEEESIVTKQKPIIQDENEIAEQQSTVVESQNGPLEVGVEKEISEELTTSSNKKVLEEQTPKMENNELQTSSINVQSSNPKLSVQEILTEAENSPYASEKFNLYIKGYRLYPENTSIKDGLRWSAERMITMGINNQSVGKFIEAISYYDLITTTLEVPNDIKTRARNFKLLAEQQDSLVKADDINQVATDSPYISEKLDLYIKGYNLYVNDERFKDGITASAERMLTLGINKHSTNDFSTAINYYNKILSLNQVTNENKVLVNKLVKLAAQNDSLVKADDINKAAGSSPYISEKLNLYIKGYELYKNDKRFTDGILASTDGMLTLAINKHSINDFDTALSYYNRVLSVAQVSNENRELINKLVKLAVQRDSLVKADDINRVARSSPYASEKFNLYIKGNMLYPEDSRFIIGIRSSSERLLALGVNNHNVGNFSSAITYYDMLINEPSIPTDIQDEAKYNKNLGEQGYYITNMTYRYTYYNMYTNEMINIQTAINPQTDLYGGGWKTATWEDTGEKINISNFVDSNLLTANADNTKIIGIGKVLASPRLNVRSKPTTQGSIVITTIDEGKEYSIIDQSNGWYKITTESGTVGWVSGSYIEVNYSGLSELTTLEISQALYIRSGPTTERDNVLGLARVGERYAIQGQTNGWYKIKVGDKFGWIEIADSRGLCVSILSNPVTSKVHALYTTANKIPREMYQFLVLSGRSGISVGSLSKELIGKGILQGRAQAFIDAGRLYDINEIYLLSHALLETSNGASDLATGVLVTKIKGKDVEPRVVYNMFGIGAKDNDALRLGSEYAYEAGWFSPEAAIVGGAEFIGGKYTSRGQDTLYKMKWNPAKPAIHQYATDIGWATKQTKYMEKFIDICERNGISNMMFDIPVYK